MTDTELDNTSNTPPNFLVRLLSDLMSNKHRGYAGLRPGGGPHPVTDIGTERGGYLPGERFDTEFTDAQLMAMLRDGILGANRDHVLRVVADGPFSGYVLPAHQFQPSQHAFPVLGATDTPTPFRVVNANPARLTVKLRLVTTPTAGRGVFIGNNENVTPNNGFPLLALGNEIELPTKNEVWACSNDNAIQLILGIVGFTREG